MKKLMLVILAAMMLVGVAVAEDVDLSNLTYDELVTLRNRCQQEMFSRDEWQEVTVPPGVYIVGVDIPAGTWTVHCSEENTRILSLQWSRLEWGDALDNNEHSIAYGSNGDVVYLYSKASDKYTAANYTYTFTVREGQYIVIPHGYNSVVFTPPVGKLDLGFK